MIGKAIMIVKAIYANLDKYNKTIIFHYLFIPRFTNIINVLC